MIKCNVFCIRAGEARGIRYVFTSADSHVNTHKANTGTFEKFEFHYIQGKNIWVYVDGMAFFIFMGGRVLYGVTDDVEHLIKNLVIIRRESFTKELRHRTILHLTHSTSSDHYEMVPSFDDLAYKYLNRFNNHQLFD